MKSCADRNVPLLLGVDVGTTECKAGLFDITAQPIAKAHRCYKILRPALGWAEEKPEDWWTAVVTTIKEVLKASKVEPRLIKGLAISCTNACLPVDKKGQALRNALMQVDQRTVGQAEWIKAKIGEERVLEITGNRIAAGSFSAPTILWIKENEPRIFEKTHKFMVPSGFIVQKLTDAFTIDTSRGATTLLFETKKGAWSEELVKEMEIPAEKLPEVHFPWETVGEVTEKAAKVTGMHKGTPVLAGSMDTVAAMAGSGTVKDGDASLILGSVARVCAVSDKPFFDSRFLNTCFATPKTWLAIGCTNAAGLSLEWLIDNFGHQETELSKNINTNPHQMFDREAEKSPAGAHGLIYLPYVAGERSPLWDPYARGVIFGLSLRNDRHDFVRAFYEGVAYSIRHNMEVLESALGREKREFRVSGGGAKSEFWLQVIADVSGKEIIPTAIVETEPLGDALIAGVGLGIYKNLEETAKIVSVGESVVPREKYRYRYSRLFDLYKNLYGHLKRTFKETSQMSL